MGDDDYLDGLVRAPNEMAANANRKGRFFSYGTALIMKMETRPTLEELPRENGRRSIGSTDNNTNR